MAGWNLKKRFAMGTVAAAVLSIALLMRCAIDLTGGSSEIGNGVVVGRIVSEQGNPACSTIVRIMLSDYNPLKNGPLTDSCIDTTNADGMYRFVARHGRAYSIQGVRMSLLTRVMASGVKLENEDITVPQCTLKAPGSITVSLPAGIDAKFGYVNVPGSDILSFVNDRSGFITLDSVPTGVIPSLEYSSPFITSSTVIRYNVPVLPADTTIVFNPSWKYARRLLLNTSASGAQVSGEVYDFPVLVRLSAVNFNFSQAKTGGEDVRFAKNDGTPLSYQIERWDPVSEHAEAWVKVDTVRGNDGSQYITMYWGASTSSVTSLSNSQAVFDTGKGFQGIWHLGETDSLAPDATGNGYAGTEYFTASIAGMIGNARHFNGTSSIIRMKGTAGGTLSFPENGHYTLSAWIYHDTLADSITYLIAGKGELQYFIKNFDRGVSTSDHERQWEFTEYHGGNIRQASTYVPATAKSWFYLVGVRDQTNQYLYVNGALAMAGYQVIGTGQGQPPRDTTDDFTIGGFLRFVTDWNQGYAYFSGAIDEVEVSSVPRSADWIKLCYMNQRADDKLVVFDK